MTTKATGNFPGSDVITVNTFDPDTGSDKMDTETITSGLVERQKRSIDDDTISVEQNMTSVDEVINKEKVVP